MSLYDLDEVATKRDIAELRAETAELRAELKTEIAGLRSELGTDLAEIRKTMTNWMVTLLVAVIGAMATISFLG